MSHRYSQKRADRSVVRVDFKFKGLNEYQRLVDKLRPALDAEFSDWSMDVDNKNCGSLHVYGKPQLSTASANSYARILLDLGARSASVVVKPRRKK